MFISILIPSKRPEFLKKCVEAIQECGGDPSEYEILVCVSKGDDKTAAICEDLNLKYTISEFTTYTYLHEYYNELAKIASGEYLFIYNDDVTMSGDSKWIDFLKSHLRPDFVNYIINCPHFPIISKKMYEVLNHISLHCYVDNWLIDGIGRGSNKLNGILFTIAHAFVSSNNGNSPIHTIPNIMEELNKDIDKIRNWSL